METTIFGVKVRVLEVDKTWDEGSWVWVRAAVVGCKDARWHRLTLDEWALAEAEMEVC